MRDSGWFKSSFSGSGDDNCVEVRWLKGPFSGGADDNCVEVHHCPATTLVRDSKNPSAAPLSFTPAAFLAFLRRSATSLPSH
jgi:hypothetical protein